MPETRLIDPYARALASTGPWKSWNSSEIPKCVVVNDYFDWQGDKPLNYPLRDCVIYETHLAGLTRHPSAGVTPSGNLQRSHRKNTLF